GEPADRWQPIAAGESTRTYAGLDARGDLTGRASGRLISYWHNLHYVLEQMQSQTTGATAMSDVRVEVSSVYPISPLTTPARYRERATYDRAAVHQALDPAYLCHLGFVVDGSPRVLPTLFVRVGDTLYLHGSTASTPWLTARRAGGLPVVVEVTHVDGLVLARSQFHHSANY